MIALVTDEVTGADTSLGCALRPEDKPYGCALTGSQGTGKTSVMAQSCADDAQDEECCLIVLDPKRDLADKALSVIPRDRRVWILDLAEPEIGINPLLIPGRPDAVADAVVEGFRDTNEDGAIMASSDRYLRQAAIGALVLALEERRMPTMGDLYRLLLPHDDTMRRRVAELCDTHGELAFTSVFFGESLPTDLRDARSQTTVKLDAPRNKIEALLGVPSVNRMLHHPFQRSLHEIIAERDVLVVRGASGSIGEGNAIKVLTWLLRCLDAALSDQQQKAERDRVRVALKVDEAHLLLSPTFARMLAVHRSAGLEAMCAWQQLSQIKDLAVREATTNLLQNRIVFRMNNPEDARAEIGVMMSAYADLLQGSRESRALTRFQPDMLVNLDVFYALCSWVAGGRRADAFVGRTIRPREDPELIAQHECAQRERGAFVVERLPNLVAPRSWVRRAAVVGVDAVAEEGAPEPLAVEAAATFDVPGAPASEGEPPADAAPAAPVDAAAGDRVNGGPDTAVVDGSDAAPAPGPPPDESARAPRLRRVRIEAEPFDPARTGGGDPREVIDSQPVGTHIRLEHSYTELAIDQPLRLKYEPARSLADEKALARVDARAKQILAALHEAGFLLAPQIGRRYWPDGTNERNIQRALARMAELGLVERFRIITADGGTQPFIYQLNKGGFEYAQTQRGPHGAFIHPEAQWRERKVSDPRYVLHNLHATAWVLSFERAAGRFVRAWHGPSHPVTRPRVPRVKEEREWVNLGPRHLKPPPNMAIHGLKFPANVDVARQEFEGLETDALIELAIPAGNSTRRVDVFVEMDRTRRPSKNSPKFRRYDHFITGWSTLLDRYAEALKERPIVVFVCEDGDQALDFLKVADSQVTGAIGVKGTEIAEWQHPARERMFFVAERDLHSGTLRALRLPTHPPKVRAALGEPRDPQPEQVSILPRRLLGPR
ncbi:MAG: replication-relaxation family protein [Solirubrobacteraceae bacterium]